VSSLRKVAATATDVACRTAGRRHVVRAARFIYRQACLDVPNDPLTNGERELQRWILGSWPTGRPIRVIDVGANVGEWSAAMLANAREADRLADLDLHAFEPSGYTFTRLTQALAGQPVRLQRAALSERAGSAPLYIAAPGAGVNSLHEAAAGTHEAELVPVTTLAAYADQCLIDDIALVKIDTEGHDLSVLRGAVPLLSAGCIAAIQFEYNHRWVFARAFLRDAFELLQPTGYRLGKLTPFGVEFYPEWEPELESFVEGNYVALTARAVAMVPAVPWWKYA
jgi:FkbM family methyltransferase